MICTLGGAGGGDRHVLTCRTVLTSLAVSPPFSHEGFFSGVFPVDRAFPQGTFLHNSVPLFMPTTGLCHFQPQCSQKPGPQVLGDAAPPPPTASSDCRHTRPSWSLAAHPVLSTLVPRPSPKRPACPHLARAPPPSALADLASLSTPTPFSQPLGDRARLRVWDASAPCAMVGSKPGTRGLS